MKRLANIICICIMAVAAISIFYCCSYAISPDGDAIKKGIAFGRQGNNDEAIGEFNKAIGINPVSGDAYYNRGFIYYKQGKVDQAISDYSKAIEIDKAYADAYYNRGLAYYKIGKFDQAISDYNKVMEIAPMASDALYGRGLAYYKKNNIKQAIADFDKVIEMRPDFPLAYSARAIAYFSKKNYGQTLSDVNKAISLGFRLRPLKEVSEAAVLEKPSSAEISIEKSQSVKVVKDPVRSQAWKAKRRLVQIKIYVLTGLLVICLGTILVLLRNRSVR